MLLYHGKIITLDQDNTILEDGAVRIMNGTITDIGTSSEMNRLFSDEETYDVRGQIVMPGAICGHTHFYGAYARGMAVPGTAPRDFPSILSQLWWNLDRALSKEDVYYSALVCIIDAIKHGTTTLIDHHASPLAIEGSLDQIAQAAHTSGTRICTCYEVTDRNGLQGADAGISENIRFLDSVKSETDPLVRGSFGLHASLTLSDRTLEKCVSAASDSSSGFHVHAAEAIADQEDSLLRSGKRVIRRLNDAGILGNKTILAHCVHVDAGEMELIRDTGTWVTHQPRSNMNNAVGVADIETMIDGGISVAFGNDGFSNDMWEEWKAAYLVHKLWHKDPRRANGARIVYAGTRETARLAGVFWPESKSGVIEPGAFADLMIVDYHPFTELNAGNLPWHILFGFDGTLVTGTICNGQWLMKDRQLMTLDEAEIAARTRELSKKAWQRMANF